MNKSQDGLKNYSLYLFAARGYTYKYIYQSLSDEL